MEKWYTISDKQLKKLKEIFPYIDKMAISDTGIIKVDYFIWKPCKYSNGESVQHLEQIHIER